MKQRVAFAFLLPCALCAACVQQPPEPVPQQVQRDSGPAVAPAHLHQIPDATPRWEALSRYGNPPSYEVFGIRYQLLAQRENYQEQGIASWYGLKFHGERTSSGVPYDMYAMTAAHKTLPLPTYVQVKSLDTGKTVVVKVNDRGPFHADRIIDLSYTAAYKLGFLEQGTGRVEVTSITPPPSAEIRTQPTQTSTARPMYLQVGAFSQRDNAEILRNKLQLDNALGAVSISMPSAGQSDLYRVRLGPIHRQTDVDRLTQRLIQLGIVRSQLIIPSSPIE